MSDSDDQWIRLSLINLQTLVDTLLGVTARNDYTSIKFEQAIEKFEQVVEYFDLEQGLVDLSYSLGERIPTELEVIHDTLLTILDRLDELDGSLSGKKKTGKLRSDILNKRIDSIRRQLEIHHQRKNYLEEQGAKYGGETPFNIFSDILRETERIAALESELNERLEAHQKLDT